MSFSSGKMKLKLNTTQASSQAASDSPRPSATPVQTPGGSSLKISFKNAGAGSPPAASPPPPPQARAKPKTAAKTTTPASKKRPRDDDGNDGNQTSAKRQQKANGTPKKKAATTQQNATKKAARKGSTIRLSNIGAAPRKSSLIKLKSGSQSQPQTPIGSTRLKIKAKGKPPPRPLGVGYDSEAEDAEEDPAIEENLVLRMLPGPDCDYLSKAIEEKKIGVPVSQGGADVGFRFFTRDGRRAAVNIQGRCYAAILVDLPCIIESMKSWDKKGWWKSADVCQMLLVLGRIEKEEEAKDYQLPKELDQKTWQWPHGLTPPMYNVRKRRFRKRVSHKTIEAAEEEVERLLQADQQAITQKGRSSYEIIDPDALRSQAGDSGEEEDGDVEMDGYGFDEAEANGEDFDEGDHEAFAARMELELGAGMEDDEDDDDDDDLLVATPAPGAAVQTVEKSVESPAVESAGPSAAPTPMPDVPSDAVESADTGGEEGEEEESDDDDDDDEEDDDDDDDEEEEEVDEDARERAQYLAQQREEIAHLEKELANQQELLKGMQNPILRQRITAKIKSIEGDLDVKRRALGEGDDDED